MQNLTHIRAQSLPHILALLLHPPSTFPPQDCRLLVVDSASGPFASYFPNPTELKARLAQSKNIDKAQVQWLMNRSSNVTSDLANQLMKLATTHRMAVLAINQTRTRIKGQPRATLCPVLTGGAWESSISTRLVLYRDILTTENTVEGIRCAEVMKRSGKILAVRLGANIVQFVIEKVWSNILTISNWLTRDRMGCVLWTISRPLVRPLWTLAKHGTHLYRENARLTRLQIARMKVILMQNTDGWMTTASRNDTVRENETRCSQFLHGYIPL